MIEMKLGARGIMFIILIIGIMIVTISLFSPLTIAFYYMAVGFGMIIVSLFEMRIYKFFFK